MPIQTKTYTHRSLLRMPEYLNELLIAISKSTKRSRNQVIVDLLAASEEVRQVDFDLNCVWDSPLDFGVDQVHPFID